MEIDKAKKNFRLSAPIFSDDADLPKAIAAYFASLPVNATTTLAVNEESQILFEQQLPCHWGPQPTLREQLYRFLRRARRCQHLLRSAANDERRGAAQAFLDS